MKLKMRTHHLVRSTPVVLVLAFGAGVFSACSKEEAPPPTTTYHEQVRPLLEAHCGSCHYDGGPAPFSVTYKAEEWKEGAPAWVGSAVSAVEDGRMPPWLPATDCKDLAFARVLSDEEKALLQTWRDDGFAEGDAAKYSAPKEGEAPPELGKPALEVQPETPYAPSPDLTDDYRCFVLPTEFTEETYLTASAVAPGEQAIVHHALIYLIPQEGFATIDALDKADEGPGYQCFGGPGGNSLTTLGAWVPGSVVQPTPPGSAFVLPAKSRLVLQIHYNTLALNGKAPPKDLSTVKLWTSKEKPESRIELLPLAHLGMSIPAGDEASVQERVFEMPTSADIIALGPHMHLLGTSIEVAWEPKTTESACLIDIPKWDFHWQQTYPFPKDGVVKAQKGDKLRVRCTYNNSAANQPVVNGEKQAPRDVTWGEGTLDEMCLVYIAAKVPYEAPNFYCGAYPGCVSSCADGDSACFFDCSTVGGGQCAGCLIQAMAKCAAPYCASTGIALKNCTEGCGGAGPSCLKYDCKAEFDAFYGCMEPHLENGDCGAQLSACGAE